MYLPPYLPPQTEVSPPISNADALIILVVVAVIFIPIFMAVSFAVFDFNPLDCIHYFLFKRRLQEVDVLKQIARQEESGLSLYQIVVSSELPIHRVKRIIKRLESQDLIQTGFDLDTGRIVYKIK